MQGKLRQYLAKAEFNARKGGEAVARQRALLGDLEREGRDTLLAEALLQTLIRTQQLHDETVARLRKELGVDADQSPSHRLDNQGNRILAALLHDELGALQPFMQRINLRLRQRLQSAGRRAKEVHFIERGMVSVLAI